MGYRACLDDLYALQRFGIKLGLENTTRLLERLGSPQDGLRIVHIAGTNGKGSTAAALTSVLRQADLRVGLYTSPHLHDFTERIQIDGRPVPQQEVVDIMTEVRPLCAELNVTFFEATTALALCAFRRAGVEWVVLEVGMGGRLDATNVVTPELAVITPISFDHAEHLGFSLAEIAQEKAGIIKPEVPVLSAYQDPKAAAVLSAQAEQRHAPIAFAGTDFRCRPAAGESFDYCGLDRTLVGLRAGLPGSHQIDNMGLALAAAELLMRQGVVIPEQALRDGVENTRWPGRLEWIEQRNRRFLLDGAHNPAGAEVLATYLAGCDPARIHWVVGCKADKNFTGIFDPLLPLMTRVYACHPPVESATEPNLLCAYANQQGVGADVYDHATDAITAAVAAAADNDVILVAGSLFLVAEARALLFGNTPDSPRGTQ
ncbi:MAG: bifunctional folylpolyglutamate synthase/dihydrofolate synthase [Desulfuromonas sp.]|nr:MAG: bifunctional folylpolyglutamate synthase/dihydrofolate synthase [Desulfuromonas sp.]